MCRIPGSSWKNVQSNGVDLCRQTVCKLMSRLEELKSRTKKARKRVYKISFASWDVFKTDDLHTCKCLLVYPSEPSAELMSDFYGKFLEHSVCVNQRRFVCWKYSIFRVHFSFKLGKIWLEFLGYRNNWIIKKRAILEKQQKEWLWSRGNENPLSWYPVVSSVDNLLSALLTFVPSIFRYHIWSARQ